MLQISDDQFDEIISEALKELPEKHTSRLNNVAIIMGDDPTPEQREKMHLHPGESLYGLYEGIPLTRRGSGYNLVLPDKITIFKNPMLANYDDLAGFKAQVKHTLWHEIAHYFGLNHEQIYKIESQWR